MEANSGKFLYDFHEIASFFFSFHWKRFPAQAFIQLAISVPSFDSEKFREESGIR